MKINNIGKLQSHDVKYLGIQLVRRLTWKQHMEAKIQEPTLWMFHKILCRSVLNLLRFNYQLYDPKF